MGASRQAAKSNIQRLSVVFSNDLDVCLSSLSVVCVVFGMICFRTSFLASNVGVACHIVLCCTAGDFLPAGGFDTAKVRVGNA